MTLIKYIGLTVAFAVFFVAAFWAIGAFATQNPWFLTDGYGAAETEGRAWLVVFSLIGGAWAASFPEFWE